MTIPGFQLGTRHSFPGFPARMSWKARDESHLVPSGKPGNKAIYLEATSFPGSFI